MVPGHGFNCRFHGNPAFTLDIALDSTIRLQRISARYARPTEPHRRINIIIPHISPAEEMVELMDASRGFEANTAAMSAVKDMVAKSIDLLKI